jgi:hypothetical protein
MTSETESGLGLFTYDVEGVNLPADRLKQLQIWDGAGVVMEHST